MSGHVIKFEAKLFQLTTKKNVFEEQVLGRLLYCGDRKSSHSE